MRLQHWHETKDEAAFAPFSEPENWADTPGFEALRARYQQAEMADNFMRDFEDWKRSYAQTAFDVNDKLQTALRYAARLALDGGDCRLLPR